MIRLTTTFEVESCDLIEFFNSLYPHIASITLGQTPLDMASYSAYSDQNESFFQLPSLKDGIKEFDGRTRRAIAHFDAREEDRQSEISSVAFICHQHDPTSIIKASIEVSGKDTESVRSLRNIMSEKAPGIALKLFENAQVKSSSQSLSENGKSFSGLPEQKTSSPIDSLLKNPKEHIPRVFISYSHDSEMHKEWVAQLAHKLNSIGVWVVFDQWDTDAGSDLHQFMNSGIKNSDRILVICTEKYNEKAEANQGGAAYERMLMTPELFNNTASTKIIPIVRGSQKPKTPSYLASRRYIDFTDDSEFESSWLKLGRALLAQESARPAFGV